MEAEKEQDPFASIVKLCRPTASQEAKFPCCPFARESENFLDSQPDPFSLSTDPTPSETAEIFMVSLPATPSSVQQHAEEDAVFHTPPEHHANSHLSSSEEQNVNELCVEEVGVVDGPDRVNKVRVSETGLENEPEAKKIRVLEEKLDGDTVPVGETEVIEMERNQVVDDTKVNVVDSHHSDDVITTVNLGEDSVDITSGGLMITVVPNIDELVKGTKSDVDAVTGNHKLGRRCKSLEETGVDKSEKSYEKSGSSRSLDSGKVKEEIAKLKCIAGNICIEIEQRSGVGGSEKIAKITKDANMSKDCYQNRGLETDGKSIKENGLEPDGKRIEELGQTDCNRIEKTGLETDSERIEKNGLETDSERIEETGPEIINQKVEDIVVESDGKKIEETGLITDGKRIEKITQETNSKNTEEMDWKADGKRSEEVGRETNGKNTEEMGWKSDGKRSEEVGRETNGKNTEEMGWKADGKRSEEVGRETNGKNTEEMGWKADGKRSEEVGRNTNGKKIEDIDGFRYTGSDDRSWKGRTRQLPVSLQGKEEEVVGNVQTKHGLMDFLDVLKAFVGDTDGGCEDVDFLDTAKRRGLTFPRPRWWASEGSD